MLSEKFLQELREYIENNREQPKLLAYSIVQSEPSFCLPDIQESDLENYIKSKRQPTFKEVLFNLIDIKNTTDAEVYHKAGIDRKHFSKIRSKPQYHPSKNTVIALALALELNRSTADSLLFSAGYSLSDSETFDLVIQFCLNKKIYNLDDVNQALSYFSLNPLSVR